MSSKKKRKGKKNIPNGSVTIHHKNSWILKPEMINKRIFPNNKPKKSEDIHLSSILVTLQEYSDTRMSFMGIS